jgi:hypothetical protein
VLLFFSSSWVEAQVHQSQGQVIEMKGYNQARLNAIQDFSKTKLFKKDTVFYISFYDTLHRVGTKKIGQNNYKSVAAKAYPNIIAVNILGYPNKCFFDTTVSLSNQKAIPSRFIENNGKVFIWWDKNCPLTDSTIKVLDRYHLIARGGHNDWVKFIPGTDDSKQGIDYFFCRSNLSISKKKITSIAIGYYAPPKLKCQ